MIVVVEGNIGAGKTTFCQDLYEQLTAAERRSVVFVKEPVERWTNANGENLLKLFYEDKKRWAFTFQCLVLATTIQNESRAVRLSEEGHIVIMERSSFSCKEIFSELLRADVFTPAETRAFHELKAISESPLQTYLNVVVVYLNTPPHVCCTRIYERARTEEVGLIDFPYLQRLHVAHENKMRVDTVHGILLEVDGASYERGAVIRAILVQRRSTHRKFYDALLTFIPANV